MALGICAKTRSVNSRFVAGFITSASSLYSRAKTRKDVPVHRRGGDAKGNARHRARL